MRVGRGLGFALAVMLLSVSRPAHAEMVDGFSTPQQLVAIDGGRRLNLFCLGSGAPTVLLDAGAGSGIMDWRRVQGRVAAFTHVCAYDRAGLGHSDPLTATADVVERVEDIHRLIQKAPLPIPIVYVGHSIAGLFGTFLQGKYPADVAGEVLVDPSFSHQEDLFLARLSPADREAMYDRDAKDQVAGRTCLTLAVAGALDAATTPTEKACLDPTGYPGLTDAGVSDEIARQIRTLSIWFASTAELEDVIDVAHRNIDDQEMDERVITFGAKPLAVLTSDSERAPPNIAQQIRTAHAEAWKQGHDALASLSTRGSNMTVSGSGHFIQIDRPDVVVSSIKKVIEEVRAQSDHVSRQAPP